MFPSRGQDLGRWAVFVGEKQKCATTPKPLAVEQQPQSCGSKCVDRHGQSEAKSSADGRNRERLPTGGSTQQPMKGKDWEGTRLSRPSAWIVLFLVLITVWVLFPSACDVHSGRCATPPKPLAVEQQLQSCGSKCVDRHGQSEAKRLADGRNRERLPTGGSTQQPMKEKGLKGTRLSWRINLLVGLLACIVFLPSACGTTVICPENQTAELGGQGYISCNFPDDYNEVYWSDDASDSSSPMIIFKPNEEVKYGPGLESGAYDVNQNGTLIIRNVTKWHERVYKVIVYTRSSFSHDTFPISLKVTASPGNQFPTVVCHNCHGEYYYSLKYKETPSCSFSAARPPVQLEWFEHFDDGYNLVEMQQFNSTENRNGTYNSLATLHSLKDSSNLIHSLLCSATWPLSDWRREKEILVDSSNNKSFADVTPKTQYVVVNTHAVIKCGESSSVYMVWKRILTNSEPELIGFHSHAMTETISSIPDVEVSAEGNLIFSSPQVHHEGNYACIYGDGQKEEILMTSVELLIPPSPPYIQITGCDDVFYSCVVKEDSFKKLTCAVYGVRPNASLEWIAENKDEISFFNHKEDSIEGSETTDIILSVEYKVSQYILCGEEILIGCHLYGPLTKIMKEESTAIIVPASCKENEEKGDHRLDGSDIALIVICILLMAVIVVICMIYILCYRIKSRTTAKHAHNGVAIDDLQEISV